MAVPVSFDLPVARERVWPGDQSRSFDARVAGLTSAPRRRPAEADQSSETAEPAEVQRRNRLLQAAPLLQ